jgi:hypothetical protein
MEAWLHHFVGRARSCGFIVKSECDRLQDNVITGGDVSTGVCGVHAICMTQDDYKMRSRWKEAGRSVFKNKCPFGRTEVQGVWERGVVETVWMGEGVRKKRPESSA